MHAERRHWGRVICVALLPVLLVSRAVVAQHSADPRDSRAFSTASSDWQGMSEFIRLAQKQLGTGRTKLTATLDYSELRPQDAVVIVHPEVAPNERELTEFLAAGGRVAMLDDYGKSDNFLKRFGIRLVPAPLSPRSMLQQDPDLALATPVAQVVAGAERGRHPIAASVRYVATNHPRAIDHPDLTPILEIRESDTTAAPVAVTGIIAGEGRLLVVSDPSVLINLMLRYPGNRRFASGMLDYLVERETALGGAGKLWILANDFDQRGAFGGDSSLLDDASDKLRSAERALENLDQQGIPPWLALALAALLGAWAVISQLRDNLRFPPIPLPGFARPPLLAAQVGAHARAQVLGGKNAPPVLALVEMESALREAAAHVLRVDAHTSPQELESSLRRAGLSQEQSASYAALMAALRRHGQSLSQGSPRRPSRSELKRLHHQSMAAIEAIRRAGGSR